MEANQTRLGVERQQQRVERANGTASAKVMAKRRREVRKEKVWITGLGKATALTEGPGEGGGANQGVGETAGHG